MLPSAAFGVGLFLTCAAFVAPLRAAPADPALAEAALGSIQKMAAYFADDVAVQGGYVWAYSPDLALRQGEGGEVGPGVVWSQPPGTPAFGAAFLRLHELTGDARWLEAARVTAQSLISTQLLSGGWFNYADTDPVKRATWCYVAEGVDGKACKVMNENEYRNRSSLDDNITQSALGFLLWLSEYTGEGEPGLEDALEFALSRLTVAQFRNGAWPVNLDRLFPPARMAAAWRARYPESWSRDWIKPDDPPFMITNDHLIRNTVRFLLAAADQLENEELLAAAMRSGDFLLAAQLPAPQRGWAQTYNVDLEPVWGRRFEPPAVASRETAGAIETLLQLYLWTGKKRFLEGALEAADWLRQARRASGDWARFYELETNRPLFVDREGALGYEDDNLFEGYAFFGPFGIEPVLDLAETIAVGGAKNAFAGRDWIFEPTPPRRRRGAVAPPRGGG